MEENYLKYQILLFGNSMLHSHNTNQLDSELYKQIANYEQYKKFFTKCFNNLKDDGFIYTSTNSTGTPTITGVTEKGKQILKFNSWNEYEDSLHLEKQKEKDLKDLELRLKEVTLKNQKFTPYISILGLVFGLGSMIWSIMDKYKLVFIDISIYFVLLLVFAIIGIFIFKKINF